MPEPPQTSNDLAAQVEEPSRHKIRCMEVCEVFELLPEAMRNSNIHGFPITVRHKDIQEFSFALKQISRLVNIGLIVNNTDKQKLTVTKNIRDWFIDPSGSYIEPQAGIDELIKQLHLFYAALETLEKKADQQSLKSLRNVASFVTEIENIYNSVEFLVR